MLTSLLWILLMGFFVGQIARRLKAPPLFGMILAGIILGPEVANVLTSEILESAQSLRIIAVMIILMKAGLGLDWEKLAQQGSVAIRLGFLPATFEAVVVAIASIFLFQLDWMTGLLLGCVVGAESPAVIVPGMLRLKSLGWGVSKGIPDTILTGSAVSDVLLLLLFNLLLNFLSQGMDTGITLPGGLTLNALELLPLQVISQIAVGIGLGFCAARWLISLLVRQNWTQNSVQDTLVVAGIALLLVVTAEQIPLFSGYMAVMSTGYFLLEFDAPLAREIRKGFDGLWIGAEIILFVLMGASVQLSVLGDVLLPGLLLLAIGTLIGRGLGWYLSTLGSNWTPSERLFLLAGNSAKATVQAAIGAIPLAYGIAGGEIILAIAALSILVTAPLGAWAIPTFAPKLLQKGEVDPTKVNISRPVRLLVAVDTSPLSHPIMVKAADLARRGNSEVIVLHVLCTDDPLGLDNLRQSARQVFADIRHRFITVTGSISEEIVRTAQQYQVDEIIMGKRGKRSLSEQILVNSVSQAILETAAIPVIIVTPPYVLQ